MTDQEWLQFFTVCTRVLGRGDRMAHKSESWCGWTTFSKLGEDVFYWRGGLPSEDELASTYVKDGGTWGQPFSYQDIAHIVIPHEFFWDTRIGGYQSGFKEQDLQCLSQQLAEIGIEHRKTDIILEIKLY